MPSGHVACGFGRQRELGAGIIRTQPERMAASCALELTHATLVRHPADRAARQRYRAPGCAWSIRQMPPEPWDPLATILAPLTRALGCRVAISTSVAAAFRPCRYGSHEQKRTHSMETTMGAKRAVLPYRELGSRSAADRQWASARSFAL